MSVLSVTRSWASLEYRNAGARERREFYTVLTSTAAGDAVEEIEGHLDVPKRGDAHPTATELYVRDVAIRQGAGPAIWLVEVSYSDQDPTAEAAAIVSIGGLARELQMDADANGVPITNTAGEPFDAPIRVQVEEPLVTWAKQFPATTVDLAWLEQWADKVNDADLAGVGLAGEVRIVGMPAAQFVRAADGGDDYYLVTFRLHIRRTGVDDPAGTAHWRKVLCQGYRYLVGTNEDGQPVYRVATDDAGLPLQRPVLLTAAGTLLPAGDDPEFVYWQVYGTVDMEPLGIELP